MIAFIGILAQLAIVARGPDVANVCQPFDLTVAVRAPGAVVPQITAPSLSPFDILRSSPSPQVAVQAGGGSVLAEFRYVLTTEQTGTFVIPSFEARLGQTVVRSQPLRITVRGPRADNVPAIITRARVDTGLDVNFRAIASPETVYVGQQVNYEVAVFLNENVQSRLRRNPTFYPPDIRSMLAYDLAVIGAPPRLRVGSRCFDALVYQRALFPLIAGKFVIPPSQLVYALSTSAGFFSREESHDLQTDRAMVVAVDPPVASRPADWTGAVGSLNVAARLDTNVTRVGDPLLLTVQVEGAGNVKLFPRPDIHIPWASVVRGDERVRVDTSSSRIRGAKEFDWVLTPKVAGELDVPPIQYSYFNPDQRRYAEATTAPTHVRVGPGALAASDTVKPDDILSIRPRYTGPVRAPFHEYFAFWLLVAVAPLPAIGFGVRDRRRRTIRAAPAIERLTRLAATKVDASAAPTVRHAFGDALGARLGLPPSAFTRPGALTRALRRSGVSRDAAEDCERLMRELDGAAYSRNRDVAADIAERAVGLYRTVDAEALTRDEIRLPLAGLSVLFMVVATAVTLHAATDSPISTFDRGVTAYQQHEYSAARDAFRQVTRDEPRAADAWANYGTAAWADGDTAHAVVGWQRALRLEPLASDVRDRTELAHGVQVGSAAYVMPAPVSVLAAIGLLLWIAGWGYVGRAAWLGSGASRPMVASIVGAGVVLVATVGVGLQLSGHNVGVIRATTQLSTEPVLGSDRSASVLVGEVVRVRTVRGAWTLVRLDDGRDGWIDSSVLLSVDPADSSGD